MIENPTLKNSIKLAIKTEQIGAKFYETLSEKFDDKPNVRDIFSQLASDEKVHEKQFTELLNSLPEEDKMTDTDKDNIKAASISGFFQTDAFKGIAKIDKPEEALRRAFEFEKTSLVYYSAIRDVLGESTQLNGIIDAEKSHMVNLMKVILGDAEFRGLQDEWT